MDNIMNNLIWIILLNIGVYALFVYGFKKEFKPMDSLINWIVFMGFYFCVVAYNPKYSMILAIVSFILVLIIIAYVALYLTGKQRGVIIWDSIGFQILKKGGHPYAIAFYSIILFLLISGFFDAYITNFSI
jgi:hypothetical protein